MEKLTLFELHFDGAQFGPRNIDGEEADESTDDEIASESSGGNRVLRLVAASIIMSLVATAIARLVRRSDSEFEFEDEPEDISLETVDA